MNTNIFTFTKQNRRDREPNVFLFRKDEPITKEEAREIFDYMTEKVVINQKEDLYGELTSDGIFRVPLKQSVVKPDMYPGGTLILERASVDLDKTYNSCALLSRLAGGCASCETCKNITIHNKRINLSMLDYSDTGGFDVRKPKKIMNYDYVSPKNIADTKAFEATTESDIDMTNIDYETIQANAEAASQRAKDAADTRKYIKEECSRCILKSACKKSKGWCHPCRQFGSHFSNEKSIIDRLYPEIKTMTEKQRKMISRVAYMGSNHVKIGRSNRYRICGVIDKNGRVPVIKDYYPFDEKSISWEELESMPPKDFQMMSDVQLAIYKSLTKECLGRYIRILGHNNVYLGVSWNGYDSISMITATSTNEWFSKMEDFGDIYHALRRI